MSDPGRPSFPPPRQLAISRRGGGSRRALGCMLVTVSSFASAAPVLHEYIELGPGRGLVEPAIPATPSSAGQEGAGDGEPGGAALEVGGAPAMPGATFSIDRDTTRPDRVSYSDPFTPTVVPFKRSVVYDTVNRIGELLVRDTTLSDVGTQAQAQARATDEHFHASMRLDLKAGERTPVPSVAPGARLVIAHAEPRVPLRIGVDSAENWFVEAKVTEQILLTLQVVADRRAFGSEFGSPGWSDLARRLPPLPVEVKRSAVEVARALGVDESAPPSRAVEDLVEHFRRFTPSERKPQSHGLALYRELALTARGICRHRAYAFMITALGLGIPTRLALNEAHAWVEVYDGDLWHRIDLGGAAEQLEMDDEGRPRHVEPSDPFDWPDRDESGLAMAERRVPIPGTEAETGSEPASAEGQSEPPAPAPAPTPPEQDPTNPSAPSLGAPEPLEPAADPPAPPAEPAAAPPPALPDDLAPGSVLLRTGAARAERGKGLFVSGQVQDEGRACSGASIEITLQQAGGQALALGTLVSDARGEFRGHLVVPWSASLGEHTLAATARGHCPRR